MKAKKYLERASRNHSREDVLPHQLGTHLFAMIRRNLAMRGRVNPQPPVQTTFAF